jgi:ubiquinol-cytochrome c reductase cytochrome b subunit
MSHGQSDYRPNNKVAAWINDRLPVFSMMNDQVSTFPTPKNLNYWYTFGGILTFMLMVQIITGVTLVMHYTANTAMAFQSVEHIMRDVSGGWLLRYSHAVGASMFFMAVYVHIFRGMYYGSYKNPRELLWILGCTIFLLMMATAFMGYVLPWGQMSLWGATVITNLFSVFPGGETIVQWLWGGFSVDNPTLNRFFALHYLLPFVLVGIVGIHIWALHVTGNNNPLGIDVKSPQDTLPFSPYYTVKDAFALVVFCLFFAYWLFYNPNYLGHPDNYIPADSLSTPAHIVPEWYFLPFYAILRSIPDKLMGVLAMFASIGVLFVLPWLDTSKVRSASFKPIFRGFFWILVLDCVLLGYIGAKTPDNGFLVDLGLAAHDAHSTESPFLTNILVGQIATAYYFIHFLVILPILGMIETPQPLPKSISDPVLSQS